jgi:hypothetical protein
MLQCDRPSRTAKSGPEGSAVSAKQKETTKKSKRHAQEVAEQIIASAPPQVEQFTPAERASIGKAVRRQAPLDSLAEWTPSDYRVDPITLLEEQAETRLQELVPIRYGRMMVSPFTFYRGAAYVMASDLAGTPRSGLRVQACGDAHLSNFGVFASPERDLMFDMNDFDETLPAPWEWDVKRLAASFTVATREWNFDAKTRRAIVLRTVQTYREAMRRFAAMKTLDVWYSKLDMPSVLARMRNEIDPKMAARVESQLAKVKSKDNMRALEKLATTTGGEPRILSDPPLIVPMSELVHDIARDELMEVLRGVLRTYRRTLPGERRRLLEGYRLVDVARKVVGVGSVGTCAHVALLVGRDNNDPLFLQFKEAQDSVLAPFAGKEPLQEPGAACGRRSEAHAGHQRHLPGLGPGHGGGRQSARVLRPPALGRQGLRRPRDDAAGGLRGLRTDVRLDVGACPRSFG